MTTIELQHKLIKRILNLEDNALLEYLNNALTKSDTLVEVSDIEKQLLDKSGQDYKSGNIVSHAEVRNEISGWLEK